MTRTIIACFAVCAIAFMSFLPQKIDCSHRYWGTKTLYQPVDTATPQPPVGYKVAFINYVTRHGARHVVGLGDYLFLQQLLARAESENMLSDKGRALQKMIARLLEIETNENSGLLTKEGGNELYNIGRRMKEHFPTLFQNGKADLVVESTKEKRTVQSADHFLQGLGYPNSNQHLIDDSVSLRFFELAPAYRHFQKNGNWKDAMKQIEKNKETIKIYNGIAQTFFNKPFSDSLINKQLRGIVKKDKEIIDAADFAGALYNSATAVNSLQVEVKALGITPADLDIRSLLTCTELAQLEFVNSAVEFLTKAPGMDEQGIQVRDAVPLLVHFINATDSFIQYGKHTAVLRFAHAETMAPFTALLDMEGASTPAKNVLDYYKVWQAGNVIPYAANMQWVVFSPDDGKKDILVEILYNERPVSVGLHTTQFPYYKWTDLRNYYIKKLQGLHVSLNDDMYKYLQHLQ